MFLKKILSELKYLEPFHFVLAFIVLMIALMFAVAIHETEVIVDFTTSTGETFQGHCSTYKEVKCQSLDGTWYTDIYSYKKVGE